MNNLNLLLDKFDKDFTEQREWSWGNETHFKQSVKPEQVKSALEQAYTSGKRDGAEEVINEIPDDNIVYDSYPEKQLTFKSLKQSLQVNFLSPTNKE